MSHFGLWYRDNSFVTPPLRSSDLKLCLHCTEVDTHFSINLLQYYRVVHLFQLLIGARYA